MITKYIAYLLSISPILAFPQNITEFKNQWIFSADLKEVNSNWIIVKIDKQNEHDDWEIKNIEPLSRMEINRDSSVEPFVVSPDFQKWTNFYTNNVGNCDGFNVKNSELKNICFSRFARKNAKKALVGIFFGGNGNIGVSYDEVMVNKAIRNIDPGKALQALEKYENNYMK